MNRGGDPGLQVTHVRRYLFGNDDVLEPGATQQIIANLRQEDHTRLKNKRGAPEVRTLGHIL